MMFQRYYIMIYCIQYQHQKLAPRIFSSHSFYIYIFSSTTSFCIFLHPYHAPSYFFIIPVPFHFIYTFSSSLSFHIFLFSLLCPYLVTTCYLYTSCLSSGISILHLLYLLIAPKNAITSCTIQFVLGSASASLYFHILYLIYMFTIM
jgi:hypothetical protein